MNLTVDEVLERALRLRGEPVMYWIAKGGRFDPADDAAPPGEPIDVRRELALLDPQERAEYLAKASAAGIDIDDLPAGRVPACDCSRFSNWVLRIPFTPGSPDWMNTDQMVADARGPQRVFTVLADGLPRPGALLVHPKPPDRKFGHVGIVTSVADGRMRVAHCSAANFLSPLRQAIQVTGTEEFDGQPGLALLWCRRVAA